MAQVKTFSAVPNVQEQGTTDARLRTVNFGKDAIGAGIAKFGAALGETAQKMDEIADVQAKTEANRLVVQHTLLASQIGQRVQQAQGENASAAVQQGVSDLNKGTNDILAQASPRAKAILQNELPVRNAAHDESWSNYAFDQHKVAYKANADAANKNDLNAAIVEPDEAKAAIYLDSIRKRNEDVGSFFGLGADAVKNANANVASTFFKQRALSMATNGDPTGAIQYVTKNASNMLDSDVQDVVRSYRPEMLKQVTFARVRGLPDPSGVEMKPGEAPAPTPDNPQPTPELVKVADPHSIWKNVIVQNEGTARVMDVNGHWAQYGINAAFNPELAGQLNKGGISEAQAESQFVNKYWKPSGADKLPPALAALHADTYYLSTAAAGRIMRQSGGDFDKYMALRKEWMAGLAQKNPGKFGGNVAASYERRNQNIVAYAGMVGGKHYSFEGKIGSHTDMSRVESEVMADTTVPLDYKMAYVEAARQYRGDLKQEDANRYDRAHDLAITQATKLGDGFTSLTQLDPGTVTNLSPDDYHTMSKLADNNREKKVKQDLDPFVTDVLVSDPQKFVDPKFVNTLIAKGATAEYIAGIRTRQAEVRGTMLKAQTSGKVDPLSSGELWTVAGPVAQHLGLQFDGTKDMTTGKKLNQQQLNDMANRRYTFTSYLHDRATEWATANPGKKPPEDEIKKWVAGGALRVAGPNSQRVFEANDALIYANTPEPTRQAILRRWIASGKPRPSPQDAVNIVADTIRRGYAFQGYHAR